MTAVDGDALTSVLARLESCAPNERIFLREEVLATGKACIQPLVSLASIRTDLVPSVAAWLALLAVRDETTRFEVIAALRPLAAGSNGSHANEALARLGTRAVAGSLAPSVTRTRRSNPRADVASITALRTMSASSLHAAIDGFSDKYASDWEVWLRIRPADRPHNFKRLLGKWQAVRRRGGMRRFRLQGGHEPPFLDDLLADASAPLSVISPVTVGSVRQRTGAESEALLSLWDTFAKLAVIGAAGCVGITKAILLLTDGRIGPAFDSSVRKKIGVGADLTGPRWVGLLEAVADDVTAFELLNGPLRESVPRRFAHLETGRLYDMALGPRRRK